VMRRRAAVGTHRHGQSDRAMGQPGKGPGHGPNNQPDGREHAPRQGSPDFTEARRHRVSPIVAPTDRPYWSPQRFLKMPARNPIADAAGSAIPDRAAIAVALFVAMGVTVVVRIRSQERVRSLRRVAPSRPRPKRHTMCGSHYRWHVRVAGGTLESPLSAMEKRATLSLRAVITWHSPEASCRVALHPTG
jgi:hypothetical protein